MDNSNNFIFLTYNESKALLFYLKSRLLVDIATNESLGEEEVFFNKDARYLLSALLKLQNKYDNREK